MKVAPSDCDTYSGPSVNSLVAIQVGDDEDALTSRVEDRADERLVLAAPLDGLGLPVYAVSGTSISVFWSTEQSLLELPATLLDTRGLPVPVWDVRPDGQPIRSQRRASFRLDLNLPLRVSVDEDDLDATMLDLSEGGLRCRVSARTDFEVGAEVQVTFPIDGQTLVLPARVLRTGFTESEHTRELGLCFTDPDRQQGEAIRRYIFQEQLRRRAKGLG